MSRTTGRSLPVAFASHRMQCGIVRKAALLPSRLGCLAIKFVRQLGNARRGVAAVEFAVAAPTLILIIFGFIAFNAVFYCMAVMQTNAQYAAMAVATKLVTANAAGAFSANSSSGPTACSSVKVTSTTAEYYACQGMPAWASFSVATSESCGGTVPTITVTITTSTESAALGDLFNLFTGQTLSVSSVAMMQGQCP